jgi:hypothetical protein
MFNDSFDHWRTLLLSDKNTCYYIYYMQTQVSGDSQSKIIQEDLLCGSICSFYSSLFANELDLKDAKPISLASFYHCAELGKQIREDNSDIEGILREQWKHVTELLHFFNLDEEVCNILKALCTYEDGSTQVNPSSLLQLLRFCHVNLCGGDSLINEQYEHISETMKVENLARLLIEKSYNDKEETEEDTETEDEQTNAYNESVVFDERVVNLLLRALGFSHLISKYRRVRAELTSKCEHVVILPQFTSIACSDTSDILIRNNELCEGKDASITQLNRKGQKAPKFYDLKCKAGCRIIADINKEYFKGQSRKR